MKKFLTVLILLSVLGSEKLFSQSMNCATATQIPLTAGAACVNGTNAGALTDNTMYGTCNATPVDVVWYTYVTNGSNNSYTLTPGTLQNAELIIYTGSCPTAGQLCPRTVRRSESPHAVHAGRCTRAGHQRHG